MYLYLWQFILGKRNGIVRSFCIIISLDHCPHTIWIWRCRQSGWGGAVPGPWHQNGASRLPVQEERQLSSLGKSILFGTGAALGVTVS